MDGDEIKKQLDNAKLSPKRKEEILALIDQAKTVKELDALRGDVVSILDPETLRAWQAKNQTLKTCPACGRRR